jgi:spore maturation protein CgeB
MHIIAAGGFVMTNYSDVVQLAFKSGFHIETFRTFEELKDKTDYYLKHEEERRKIAHNGYQEFLAKHRMRDKLSTIFNEVSRGLQGPAI